MSWTGVVKRGPPRYRTEHKRGTPRLYPEGEPMVLTHEDRTAVTELISMHGHLVDSGRFDRMGELFTEDAIYDVGDLGGPQLRGLAAARDAALALGDRNPLGHHVTNIVLTELADG